MNPELVDQFEAAGLRFVGKDDTGTRMEIVELAGHRFFVAAQVRSCAAWRSSLGQCGAGDACAWQCNGVPAGLARHQVACGA